MCEVEPCVITCTYFFVYKNSSFIGFDEIQR